MRRLGRMSEQHIKEDGDVLVIERDSAHVLTQQECDILGEIANISFGSASTILSTLLNKQVSITAPRVEALDLYHTSEVEAPHVVLNIQFTKGLDMENLLVLQQDVALAIADLMMMGTGEIEDGRELTELELSAVQEAMNQMMGFAATSMTEFFQDAVDMSPPAIKIVNLKEEFEKISGDDESNTIVKVAFDLKIGDLVDSKLVQIVSLENAKQMINKLLHITDNEVEERVEVTAEETSLEEISLEENSSVGRLTQEEKDVLGEIANISIGSASTVLSTLLNQSVMISVPTVETINTRHYDGVPMPFVILNVDFVEGLKHENMFVFSKEVALIMVDLMMMGTGDVDIEQELTELELSGIKEIMNQMMGHAATSMSEMFAEKMDISPPTVKFVTLQEEIHYISEGNETDELVQITFNLDIGNRVHSKMYQILPLSEAKAMVGRLLGTEKIEEVPVVQETEVVSESVMIQEVQEETTTYTINELLQNVEVDVKFVFGSTTKTIQEILHLHENETVTLDEDIDEPLRIYVNDVLMAYGELVNVGGFFGVKVTKVL